MEEHNQIPETPEIPEVSEHSENSEHSEIPEQTPPTPPQEENFSYPMYFEIPPYPETTFPNKPEPLPMNRKIFIMCCVMAGMIFVLCMYCMISDILHGALTETETTTSVILQTQEKPDLDPEQENVTAEGEYTVRGVAELVKPSIVEVYVYDENKNLSGTGSGIIISEDGYIITNAHVVQGNDYSVMLDDESEFSAQLIGIDNKTDLAVLKINAGNLTPAVLGDSDETYVGETVLAIGNPAGLANTVTKGIVSAINRQIRAQSSSFRMECIQTDAAISPGNSGGALVNMYGQVIGITSSKYASQYAASQVYEGLGFAISMNQALPIVQELIENGYVSGRFRIGIVFMETSNMYVPEQFQEQFGSEIPDELKNSLWITEVSPDCSIANTDLRANDFILAINGQLVYNYDSVMEVLDGFKGGDTVTAHCARYDKNKISYFDIEFQLEEDTSGNY